MSVRRGGRGRRSAGRRLAFLAPGMSFASGWHLCYEVWTQIAGQACANGAPWLSRCWHRVSCWLHALPRDRAVGLPPRRLPLRPWSRGRAPGIRLRQSRRKDAHCGYAPTMADPMWGIVLPSRIGRPKGAGWLQGSATNPRCRFSGPWVLSSRMPASPRFVCRGAQSYNQATGLLAAAPSTRSRTRKGWFPRAAAPHKARDSC